MGPSTFPGGQRVGSPFPYRKWVALSVPLLPPHGWAAACGEENLDISENKVSGGTSDPACRILRVAGQLLGNLDAVRSAAAVRPGTTRKVEVRVAWRANALGLKSVRTKPKSQRRKAI